MSFGGSGSGSSSIAGATDVNLNNPSEGQVLAYGASASKWHNVTISSGGSGSSLPVGHFATFIWDGSTARAVKQADGTVIDSGSTPATVLQAAVNAADNAGGGYILIAEGTIPISQPIVMKAMTGLVGFSSSVTNTGNATASGTVLEASGSMGTDDAIIEAGSDSDTVAGVFISGLALNGNKQSMCWHSQNANAPVLQNCQLLNGNPYCTWFESSKAPNPFPGGGFAARLFNCMFTGGGGTACLRSSGQGATDGIVTGCTFHVQQCSKGLDVAGGWLITGCHITGNINTQALIEMNGANSLATGNYLDTAKDGYCLIINQPKCVASGNYILNGQDGATCVRVQSAKCAITGNVLDTKGGGYGISWNGTAANPPTGSISSNFCIGLKCLVDNSNNTIPSTDTADSYMAGNTASS